MRWRWGAGRALLFKRPEVVVETYTDFLLQINTDFVLQQNGDFIHLRP